MGRRNLNRIVGQMRRESARAAEAAPKAPVSDMPFERLSIAALDKAGASLLPSLEARHQEAAKTAPSYETRDRLRAATLAEGREEEPDPVKCCAYCGGPSEAEDDFYCSRICAINAQGEED